MDLMLFWFKLIQRIFVSSLMKLNPSEIVQAEGGTRTKKSALAGMVRRSQKLGDKTSLWDRDREITEKVATIEFPPRMKRQVGK